MLTFRKKAVKLIIRKLLKNATDVPFCILTHRAYPAQLLYAVPSFLVTITKLQNCLAYTRCINMNIEFQSASLKERPCLENLVVHGRIIFTLKSLN